MLGKYLHWLHLQWPAGTVEKLPIVDEHGATNIPGLHIVGDLTGVPLLKFSADSGAKAVQTIMAESLFSSRKQDDKVIDVAIVGAGISGFSAALEAKKNGLSFVLLEAAEAFSTIHNFPAKKPIYTYPSEMTPAGELQFHEQSTIKEGLLEDLHQQTTAQGIRPTQGHVNKVGRNGAYLQLEIADQEPIRAHRVIVGIGRSGNYRKLGVPGEELSKVSNRLHDPKAYREQKVLVVGGGDSALETAIAIAESGGHIHLSYRKAELSRAKPENIARVIALAQETDSFTLALQSTPIKISEHSVTLKYQNGKIEEIANDAVFSMIGREAPLEFFRRSGVRIRGEWSPGQWLGLFAFFAFCFFVYHWKSNFGFDLKQSFKQNQWFPFNLSLVENTKSLWGTIQVSMRDPSFYYSLAYTTAIGIFGWKRIRRRKTPYVTLQTSTLFSVQVIPLFLLPYVLLPYLGHNGFFDSGIAKSVGDELFPISQWSEHGREYWRSVGLILAWPLMVWNVFTEQPMWGWLYISLAQSFVIIPLLVWKYGKGAYCGWICSCGALAETMGDTHRHKMPHGPLTNRLNLIGQIFLALALILLALRIYSWIDPSAEWADFGYRAGLQGKDLDWNKLGGLWNYVNYAWFVDLFWAGVLGVAFYFWFSGRVWCRFACPLAALMHIYARFSRFRILADKEKCISCNVCTSVCHQGIDIMNFANKGLPMEDPECVRCSACVQSCPTGVLEFGEIRQADGSVIRTAWLAASPIRIAENSNC